MPDSAPENYGGGAVVGDSTWAEMKLGTLLGFQGKPMKHHSHIELSGTRQVRDPFLSLFFFFSCSGNRKLGEKHFVGATILRVFLGVSALFEVPYVKTPWGELRDLSGRGLAIGSLDIRLAPEVYLYQRLVPPGVPIHSKLPKFKGKDWMVATQQQVASAKQARPCLQFS